MFDMPYNQIKPILRLVVVLSTDQVHTDPDWS